MMQFKTTELAQHARQVKERREQVCPRKAKEGKISETESQRSIDIMLAIQLKLEELVRTEANQPELFGLGD